MSDSDNSKHAAPASPSLNGQVDAAATPAGGARIESIAPTESGQLVVRLVDQPEPVLDARVARCFPWSVPEAYVSIRTKDGKELALLKSLDELDAASREIVRRELYDKVFNPKIQEVLEHKNEFGIRSIKAQTDRGEVTFQIRSRDDVRILSATRLLFRDADGNTYEVPDVSAMDPASQKFLQQFL